MKKWYIKQVNTYPVGADFDHEPTYQNEPLEFPMKNTTVNSFALVEAGTRS